MLKKRALSSSIKLGISDDEFIIVGKNHRLLCTSSVKSPTSTKLIKTAVPTSKKLIKYITVLSNLFRIHFNKSTYIVRLLYKLASASNNNITLNSNYTLSMDDNFTQFPNSFGVCFTDLLNLKIAQVI